MKEEEEEEEEEEETIRRLDQEREKAKEANCLEDECLIEEEKRLEQERLAAAEEEAAKGDELESLEQEQRYHARRDKYHPWQGRNEYHNQGDPSDQQETMMKEQTITMTAAGQQGIIICWFPLHVIILTMYHLPL